MADNNVFILFEEIKTALKGINGKLEALPKVAGQQPQIENNEPDLSPIKEAIVETAKAQSGEIKGLLDKHWKAYAQISTLILHHLDTIKKSQDEQGVQQEPQPQEHIHRHSFDIKSSVIVKTCSDICFTIGQKNCQMFVAKLHKFHHPHNRMRFYPAHSVLSFPDFAVDTFLPQRFLR